MAILRRTTPAGTEDTVTLILEDGMRISELADWLDRFGVNCHCDDLKIVRTEKGPAKPRKKRATIEEIILEPNGTVVARTDEGTVNLQSVTRAGRIRVGDFIETDDHNTWVHRPQNPYVP
jgi:hypothetical protein